MPWEMIADFRPALGATEEDKRFTGLALGFAKGLALEEPRLRFRIRNLPQGLHDKSRTFEEWSASAGFSLSDPTEAKEARKAYAENQRQSKGQTVIEQPIALASDDVPEILRPKLEVPRAGYYWLRNFYCQECVDSAGKPGVWVPHFRRKLHMKGQPIVFPPKDAPPDALHRGNPKKGDVFMKGIRSTWIPTHQIVMGAPSRLRAIGSIVELRYSVAVTSAPEDPLALTGYHAIVLVPLRKDVDYEAAATRLRKSLPDCENVLVLPRSPTEGIRGLLALLKEIDSAALADPIGNDAEDAADIILRISDARAHLAVDPGSTQASSDLAAALADLAVSVPERAQEAAKEAEAHGRSGAHDALMRIDEAVERVKALLDPELQEQIARDRAARRAVGNMVESKRAQASILPPSAEPKAVTP